LAQILGQLGVSLTIKRDRGRSHSHVPLQIPHVRRAGRQDGNGFA
jgi:hypothetical protein